MKTVQLATICLIFSLMVAAAYLAGFRLNLQTEAIKPLGVSPVGSVNELEQPIIATVASKHASRVGNENKSSENVSFVESVDLLSQSPQSRFEILQNYASVIVDDSTQSWVGRQVAWDDQQLVLMLPNGSMKFAKWSQLKSLNVSQVPFQPSRLLEMGAQLRQEFGASYKVTRSRDFLVVQPRGSSQPWANRMQQMLGNIQTYFSARRFPLQQQRFPLVTIVFPDREEFNRYAASQNEQVPDDYMAYYSWKTNRVAMYQSAAETQGGIGTLYHEAFHQVAFNTGLHFRSATPPRWIAEGMATAFETPGMYDHRKSTSRSDRLHPIYHRLALEYLQQQDTAVELQALVQGDERFAIDPTRAYCMSWALCFYFMEFQPQAFAQYLEITNQRKAFSVYSKHQRLTDVQNLTPRGFDDLRKRLLNFYKASLSGQ